MSSGFFERVYRLVSQVPAGRVTSYGAIAREAGGGAAAARSVGWALRALPIDRAERVPWWRVVSAKGEIRFAPNSPEAEAQRARLEAEGIRFETTGRIDLARFGWP
ncbi:MAG: MGMT family protein [Caldilineae bacterium]|nr:MGMT family protein [Chloroflexota bacterium]MCB9177219.1 MGMT family protein [Caldilineae bacterium]